MDVTSLPTLNAFLNATATVFLLVGWRFIRRREIARHRMCMLAAAIVPMVLVTLARALQQRFPRHRAIARWTLPIWLYVSVTGVVVYLMLYVI